MSTELSVLPAGAWATGSSFRLPTIIADQGDKAADGFSPFSPTSRISSRCLQGDHKLAELRNCPGTSRIIGAGNVHYEHGCLCPQIEIRSTIFRVTFFCRRS